MLWTDKIIEHAEKLIDQTEGHFVKVPVNHIVIDFDLKDGDKKKSLGLNLVEVSKSGNGLHLYYIYAGGNPERLSSIYDSECK